MRTPLSFAVLALLLADASAQISVDVLTVTPVGAAIGMPTGFTSVASLPANTVVTQPVTLAPQVIALIHSVRLMLGFPSGPHPSFTVDSRFALLPSFPPLTWIIGGTTTATTPTGTALGPVQMLGRFHASPGTGGRVEISWVRNLSAIGTAVSTAAVDVGADGTVEVSAPTTLVAVPIVVDATGILRVGVTIANYHGSLSNGFSDSLVTVRFVPHPVCTITYYGTSCQGAFSVGTQSVAGPTRTITLTLFGGFPNDVVASVFGTQNSGPALPGGCALWNDASIVMLMAADPLGQLQHQVTIPTAALGTIYHQFVPVELVTWTFRASNGLDFTCP